MNFEEVGLYARALCLQFLSGHFSLESLVNAYGEKVRGIWPRIERKFDKDAGGFFYNPRLDAEIAKRTAYVESRRANLGNYIEKGNKSNHMPHMCNRNRNINTLKNTKKKYKSEGTVNVEPEDFKAFWAAYPRKVGKLSALRLWLRLKPSESTLGAILGALAWQAKGKEWTKEGGQYIPHPATYLNGERWKDEKPSEDSVGGSQGQAPQYLA
jgi:hypothetical protein